MGIEAKRDNKFMCFLFAFNRLEQYRNKKKGGRQYIGQLTDSAAKTNSVNMKIERCIANIPLYVC